MSGLPMYGKVAFTACPTPPAGNVSLVEYMERVTAILNQLTTTHNKQITLQRLDTLKAEIVAKYPYVR